MEQGETQECLSSAVSGASEVNVLYPGCSNFYSSMDNSRDNVTLFLKIKIQS